MLATHVHPRCDRGPAGSALVAVLSVLSLGLATTAVLVLLSSAEWRLAAADRDALEARYAAEAALDRALVDLQATTAWDDVLGGVVQGSMGSCGARVKVGGTEIDLEAERQRMQARTNAGGGGPNTPRWVLFGCGRLDDVLPAAVDSRSALYVSVWVADDEAELDAAVERDSNQAVWLRAVAFGPLGARRAVEALVVRTTAAPTPVRRLVWRDASKG